MLYDALIKNISSSISLSAEELDIFLSMLECRTIARGAYLLEKGTICRHDHYISRGLVKVCYLDDAGRENIIKFAPEDWWVVDLDSFLNSKPAFYFIQAIEETEVFQLSRAAHDRLHSLIPQFHIFSNMRWQNGFIALQHRVMQGLSLPAEERYQQFLQKYPGLDQRISQKLIASYLGITPVFLSMLRRKWAHLS
ncbi:MAG: Crp/Fnr family transcriptional regulator [Chitinophagaceae bacterium]|nr:Crp/Fnr family transcriptional regulator [Chitinophagaceae bacterium]